MKQLLRNSLTVLALLFTLGLSFSASANDVKKPTSSIELKFIGNLENKPVFQLSLLNEETDEFYITITDAQGIVLYSDEVKGTNIVRKFAIDTEEIGDGTLRVVVIARSNNHKETYEISRKQTYVVDGYVTRVK
ncbi:MAG: hypothetical protein H7Y03_14520 [Chitinophagaceae bacterium]|nr:hypothetical protein [Chitinophagaceae bacterium]